MKKPIYALLAMTLTVTLFTACSNGTTGTTTPGTTTPGTTTPGTTTPGTTTTGTTTPSTTTPGTTTAGSETETTVTVAKIMEAIREAYGDKYLPNMEIPSEFLEAEFGLTSDMYEEVMGEQPMIGTHADRVVVVKAAAGKADAVETAFKTTRETKINDTLQYPMNIAKINAAQVVRNGDFVAFLLVGALNEDQEPSEEDAREFAEAEVAKAVEAFNQFFK